MPLFYLSLLLSMNAWANRHDLIGLDDLETPLP